jgi:hypothetical protein
LRRLYVVTLGLLCGLLLTLPLSAQSPIGDPFLAHPVDEELKNFQTQTILVSGELLVVWQAAASFDEPVPMSIQGRLFGIHGVGEVVTLARGVISDNGLYNQLVAARADGGFLLTFIRDDVAANSYGCHAIPFDRTGKPLASEVKFAPNGGCGLGLLALADGNFATAWLVGGDPSRRFPRVYRMFANLSPLGELISRPRRINPTRFEADDWFGSLGGNADGDMTLTWGHSPTRARSFSSYGGPLPPAFYVGFTESQSPSVVVLPSGNRLFAGLNHPPGDSNYVAYQRFAPDGRPLGPMRPAHTKRDALFGEPVLAADSSGNFVIAWGTLPSIFCNRQEARLFRADGTPVSKEFFPSLVERCEGRPQVSFGKDGTFALSWVDESGVHVAWYSASPADEPCLTRGGRLVCDTGRTGGLPEIDQPVDRPEGSLEFDALFLADSDGDGRADPCYHFGTTFRCDLGHRGRGPRAGVSFGEASDRPLMGDVDGDGRTEACVRRGDLLACDTGRDGGAAELEARFGNPDGFPLLGDLDGDRRDDLCLFHNGVFSCDLAHDGGTPEQTILFGRAGDLPVLGDFDGDGRDDPCILRGRTLRCDTKHDGGKAEALLKLAVQPGDGILMGNLDGL